jgi:hypothetical protein
VTTRDGADFESRYQQSLDREKREREADTPAGFLAFLIDFKLWSAAVLLPFGFAALGLGWLAERIGWSRWICVIVAAASTVGVLAVLFVSDEKAV